MPITPALTRACAEKLLHAALTNQGDPLGYIAFGGPHEGRDTPEDEEPDEVHESDQVDFLAELATDALGGGQPGVLERVVRTSCRERMDPVTAALLIHIGIVPAAALVLRDAALAQGVPLEIVDADADDGRDGHDGGVRITAHFETWRICLDANGTTWMSEGSLVVGPMPETLAIAAAGRPLRDIVSHKALDGIDLTVESIDAGPETSVVHLAGFEGEAMATLDVRALEDLRRAAVKRAA